METWKLILLIAAILGFIISNLMLLKHTAKFKLEKRIDEFKHGKKIGVIKKDVKPGEKEIPHKRL
ncbi:DUF2897 family protein [Corallincola spongiicola]|uniref:DUF2897 family protein n=1 Tax=Corallincola spongiicola TaxID=2520508 RepID=A0ABY1WVE6_9GAMM|nr:DUF2897 family protein [Corallincola spongiicola]TAA48647.1 DUF2897 family protein [Corallincola spongiicola]